MSEPNYAVMGRTALIAYCEHLRHVLLAANPLGWAASGDIEAASKWEREAVQALYSHTRDNPPVTGGR